MRFRFEKELLSFTPPKDIKYIDEDIEKRVANDPRVQPQHRMLTPFLLNKTTPPVPTEEERIPFSYRRNNVFSEAFYTWLNPVLATGYRRTLLPEDLPKIEEGGEYDVNTIAIYFNEKFNKYVNEAEVKYLKCHNMEDNPQNRKLIKSDPNFSYPKLLVFKAAFQTVGSDYIVGVLFKAVSDIASALNTLQIRALINYVADKKNGKDVGNVGYGYAVGIGCIIVFVGVLSGHAFNRAGIVGAEIKGLFTKIILDKSLRMSKKSKVEYPHATITSLVGNDVFKIDLAASYLPFALCLPIGLTITIVLLAVRLGGASLAGVGYFLVATMIFFFFTKKLMTWRKAANIQTDSRVRYIKEVLNNMKMLKYYAWEIPFFNLISNVRTSEMQIMLKIQFARNIITGCAVTLPLVSAMIGFLSMYGQLGGLKNAANIFSSVTLFNILTLHISLFPLAMSSSGDALIAFKRIQDFLLAEEEELDSEYKKLPYNDLKSAININDGEFTWAIEPIYSDNLSENYNEKKVLESEENSDSTSTLNSEVVLKNINLNVKHGEFIVVTGSIGTGKSSLLAAISGNILRLTGTIDISGDIILCSNPWIQNTTVRENIIFGLEYNKDIYQTVIESCSLPSDFEILPAGDKTEIGERGVNLSGGQKARINLARTVYRAYIMEQYNIVMFDDVLSAVDAKVGKHIMKECILGLLHNKTRILATHQLALIGDADRIVYMNGDGTIDIGTSEELIKRNEGFKSLMNFQMESEEVKEEDDEDDEDQDIKEEELKLIRKQTTKDEKLGKTIQAEQVKNNGISKVMFVEYLRNGCGKFGIKLVISNLIIALAFTSFCMLFENVWLSFWSLRKFKEYGDPFYIGIYVLITCMFVLCAIWQFCTIAFITNRSSRLLNINCFKNIMYAPMSFFDTTPLGRIMNRFTKDTDVLDNEIAEQARLTCLGFGNVIGVLILCAIYLPWFAIAIPVLFAYVTIVFVYYQASSRELKRIEGAARSFVFSNFDEVLQGMNTIKLFSATKRFLNRNSTNINTMNEAYFTAVCMMRWFSVLLHGSSGCVNLIVSMLCVSNKYPISAAGSGLLISYGVQFSMQIISSTRALGQLEQLLSSVERICEYATELPQEASYETSKEIELPKSWPEFGSVKFSNVSLRYRPELPLVLKNMSLDIKPCEKIGICGRTGAGKSTIMTALYRLSEPESGIMEIDGVDIQKIGLFDLRSRLAIIPQDPVLFRGDIRRNLDPFEELDDSILQNALNIASGNIEHNDENLETNKFVLDTFVDDDGANFSLGERQVIALCRALIRKAKILILDEATSSVDYETDARIQHTIATGFRDCTILCIAHRLRTILNYDRILVMDRGECAEFDTPKALWLKGGIFRSMCDKSGIEEHDF